MRSLDKQRDRRVPGFCTSNERRLDFRAISTSPTRLDARLPISSQETVMSSFANAANLPESHYTTIDGFPVPLTHSHLDWCQ